MSFQSLFYLIQLKREKNLLPLSKELSLREKQKGYFGFVCFANCFDVNLGAETNSVVSGDGWEPLGQ